MFHEYEIVTIVRPDIEESAAEAVLEKFEGLIADGGGHLLDREDWGKKKLAYSINGHVKGHYIIFRTLSLPESILDLDRRMRLDEGIIRHMFVKQGEHIDVEVRTQQAAEVRRVREEEARRRAEEEAARLAAMTLQQEQAAAAAAKPAPTPAN